MEKFVAISIGNRTLRFQDGQRYRPEISCMPFPFAQSSLDIGRDSKMSPEQVLLRQCSTLRRLLSYSWLRKLFSTVECSRCHGHVAFKPKQTASMAQLCFCTTLLGAIAVHSLFVMCQQFFHPHLIQSFHYNFVTPSSFPKFFIAEFC